MKAKALKSIAGAYLGCLFLMMTNKRYKSVKEFLHQAFLAEKQQYPHNVLAMKRFMANFIGTAAAKPKSQQHKKPKSEPAGGVAFVQPERKKRTTISFAMHAGNTTMGASTTAIKSRTPCKKESRSWPRPARSTATTAT